MMMLLPTEFSLFQSVVKKKKVRKEQAHVLAKFSREK
jgi:hypothetical protein